MHLRPYHRSLGSSKRGLAALAVAIGLLAGCQSQPAGRSAATKAPQGKPVQVIDDCSNNLQDLSGYLLEYYAVKREFPESLEGLRPLVPAGRTLPLLCPTTGKPYLYFPAGLVAPDESRRLVACESTSSPTRKRWAIVSLPPQGNTPIGLWVVQLPEMAVQKYLTAAQE